MNAKHLPGKPDILFSKSKIAIFADGDFWHGKNFNEWKKRVSPFWRTKIAKNMERDKKQTNSLKNQGYRVIRFWGSIIKKHPENVTRKIEKLINNL